MVDDEEGIRRSVAGMLSDEGFDTTPARDGEEALASIASEGLPDLVLLDIAMPVKDGLDALPEIRAASPGSRVVILSSFGEQRFGERAMQLGATAYVEKTLPPDVLVTRLVDIMEANLTP